MDVYQNETESLGIGKLTIENRTDRVTIYGSLDLTRDKAGLKSAQELKALLDAIVAYLQEQSLPEQVAFKAATEKKNPFR